LELLLQGLKVEPGNFPATMDYLRYSAIKTYQDQDSDALNALLEFIDDRIPLHVLRKPLCSKLLVLKAVILTKLSNFEEALESWIECMSLSPDIVKLETVRLKLRLFFSAG